MAIKDDGVCKRAAHQESWSSSEQKLLVVKQLSLAKLEFVSYSGQQLPIGLINAAGKPVPENYRQRKNYRTFDKF